MSKVATEDSGYLIATLSQMAIDRGSKDNVSLLLFRYKHPNETPPSHKRETIVGPCLAPYSQIYMNAYTKMANLGGLTLMEALCQRLQIAAGRYKELEMIPDMQSEIGNVKEEIMMLHNVVNTQQLNKPTTQQRQPPESLL